MGNIFYFCFVFNLVSYYKPFSLIFWGADNLSLVYSLHSSYSHYCLITYRRKNFFIVMLELICTVVALQTFTQVNIGPLKDCSDFRLS